MCLEEGGLVDLRTYGLQPLQECFTNGRCVPNELVQHTNDLIFRANFLKVLSARPSLHLEEEVMIKFTTSSRQKCDCNNLDSVDSESVRVRGALALTKFHVPKLGDRLFSVLVRRRLVQVDLDHFRIQIRSQRLVHHF